MEKQVKGVYLDVPTQEKIAQMRTVKIYNLSHRVRDLVTKDFEKFQKEQKKRNESKTKN